MEKYVIETIEFNGCWFPMRHKYEIDATCLEGALEVVVDRAGCYTDSDDIKRLKNECQDEWGYEDDDNTLLGLVYNQLLDEQNCDERIISGHLDGKELFNLLD